ncbi:MAG: biotin transporter BioY [Candidatus Coproplasma sp.]
MESKCEVLEEQAEGQGKESKKGLASGRKLIVRDICYIALFVAVLTACSWIAIPISEISITLQTMGVCMAAGFLGWKRGVLCVLAYILLGVCCVPVFSEFKNFYALIASASAGYVVGFLFTALIVGITSDKMHLIGKKVTGKAAKQVVQLIILALSMAVGVAVCYLFGTLWFMLIYKGSVTTTNLQLALTYCVYPYILPDLVKIVLSTFLVNYLKGYVKLGR